MGEFEKEKTYLLKLTDEDRRMMKAAAAERGWTVRRLIMAAVAAFLESGHDIKDIR